MQSGKEELLEVVELARLLAEEDPCGIKDGVLSTLAKGIRALIGSEYTKPISQDRFAMYLGVSTRTLQRWQKEYDDFPQPRHDGFKSVGYDPIECIEWKQKHN